MSEVEIVKRRVLVSRVQDIWTAERLLKENTEIYEDEVCIEPAPKVKGIPSYNIVILQRVKIEVPDKPAQLPLPHPEVKPYMVQRGIPLFKTWNPMAAEGVENQKAATVNAGILRQAEHHTVLHPRIVFKKKKVKK